MKSIAQLGTTLDGLTGLDREAFYGLARAVADRTAGVKHLETNANGELFGIQQAGRTVATFDARLLRRDDPEDDGRIRVGASWSEEMMAKTSQRHNGIAGIARGYIAGLPGFGPYRAYLEALAAAITDADESATVRVVVDG